MANLIELMMFAPWCARVEGDTETLHAVTMKGLPAATWPHGRSTSACGIGDVGIIAVTDDPKMPMPWPPRVASLPPGMTRCKACFDATNKPRPRSAFVGPSDG